MKKFAEVKDIVALKEFVFRSKDNAQIFVNCKVIDGPKYGGLILVEITHAWYDDETGWRYKAIPVNTELKYFLSGLNYVTLYTDEHSIDWSCDVRAAISSITGRPTKKQMSFHIITEEHDIKFNTEGDRHASMGLLSVINSADEYPSHHVAAMLEDVPYIINVTVTEKDRPRGDEKLAKPMV
jgi:hypothetical protein